MLTDKIKLTPEVIEAINEELDYQSDLPEVDRADRVDYGVAGQLVTLNTYTRKANDAFTNNAGLEASLHALRKVAAIAIRALIVAGCPRRR